MKHFYPGKSEKKGKDKLDTEAMSCGYPDGNHLETLTKEVMIHCTWKASFWLLCREKRGKYMKENE